MAAPADAPSMPSDAEESRGDKPTREIPWCAVFLVFAALSCHTLVLVGNLATAQIFSEVGESTGGWSDVGISMSRSLTGELDHTMKAATTSLTDALREIVEIESSLNVLLGNTSLKADKAVAALQMPEEQLLQLYPPAATSQLNHSAWLAADADAASLLATEVELHRREGGTMDVHRRAVLDARAAFLKDEAAMMHVGATGGRSSTGQRSVAKILPADIAQVKEWLRDQANKLLDKVKVMLPKFMDIIRPALEQIGEWISTMGSTLMDLLEQFGTTIDRVQKMFDEIMAKVSGSTGSRAELVYHSFNIFDISHTGNVTHEDMRKVAELYGLTPLLEDKGAQMIEKYDENGDHQVSKAEFNLLIDDASIPGAVTYVLRQFAKKLAQVAGQLQSARKRDEVAQTVVDYAGLQCAKNMTKIAWVTQRLVNGSVPLDFSADVMKALADSVDDPDFNHYVDVPVCIISEMVRINAPYTLRVVERVADPIYWNECGYDPDTHPVVVKRLTEWVDFEMQFRGIAMLASTRLLESGSSPEEQGSSARSGDQLPSRVAKLVEMNSRKYASVLRRQRIEMVEELFAADASQHMFRTVVGSATPVGGSQDRDVQATLSSGIDAKPETLEFAYFLACNASDTAEDFQNISFDYAKTSSNALDSFADQLLGMIKKIQNFMTLMQDYSTERGIDKLESNVMDFVYHATEDFRKVLDDYIDSYVDQLAESMGVDIEEVAAVEVAGAEKGDVPEGVFKAVTTILTELKGVLPTVISNMKFARKEVSSFAKTLNSVFTTFKTKGNPVFEMVSSMYRTLWVVYYAVFACLTFLILAYGLWSSGWFGGPAAKDVGEGPQATTFWERCCACFSACTYCCQSCTETHLCLWSALLLFQVVLLLMFSVSIVLALLAGIKAFVSAGCSQIYLLGDDVPCTGMMGIVRTWLGSFWTLMPSALEEACDVRKLTTCKVIQEKAMQSAIFTVVGSMLATVFSFQMLFEAASLFEMARWRRVANTEEALRASQPAAAASQ